MQTLDAIGPTALRSMLNGKLYSRSLDQDERGKETAYRFTVMLGQGVQKLRPTEFDTLCKLEEDLMEHPDTPLDDCAQSHQLRHINSKLIPLGLVQRVENSYLLTKQGRESLYHVYSPPQ